MPDVLDSSKEKDHEAHTYLKVPPFSIPEPDFKIDSKTGLITSFTPYPDLKLELSVETNFGTKINPDGPSDYGFGTRKGDAKRNTITFHEGSHGTEFINFIRKGVSKNPLPKFERQNGMTKEEYLKKDEEYLLKASAIHKMLLAAINYAIITVDCAGISIDAHNKGKKGYINICP